MTDKPDSDEAWLYVHHEFGREVHLMRFDAETGGTSDDYIGWAEIHLVPEASQPDASALVEAVRQSQKVFAEYAELHRGKLGRTLDSFQHREILAKVERNRDMSDMCLAALSAWEAQHG